jgi:Ni/Fe-hydrogenase 1 B-type cytochrome subunit
VGAKNPDVLVQGWMRFTHQVLGFILVAITFIRAYLFFFSESNIERRSLRDVVRIKSWITQIKSYFWMGKLKKEGVYGPLQLVTYVFVTLMSIVMCVTGLALYANVYHEGLGGLLWGFGVWVTELFGGLAQVRLWHHYVTWVFIIFIVIHIYMAIWTGVRFKHNAVDAIVSGYDYHPKGDH